MTLLDPVEGEPVGRGLRLLAWGLAVVSLVGTCVQWWLVPGFYPLGYGLAALALLLAPLVAAVPKVTRRAGDPVLAMGVFVVVGTILRLIDPIVATPPSGNTDYPPLIQSSAAALIAAGVVFRPAAAALLVSLQLTSVLYARTADVGLVQSIAEAAVDATAGFIPILLVAALRVELERAARAGQDANVALEAAAGARAFTAAQWNVDGLLHDKVLGALKHAAEGYPEAASPLAAEALAQVDGLVLSDSGLIARGQYQVLPPLVATFQSVATVLMVGWMMREIDHAKTGIERDLELARNARVEARAADVARAHITARLERLDARVMPMLRRLKAPIVLGEPDRRTCAELEKSTRDNYLAHTLLTRSIIDAIAGARSRDCTVKIEGRAEPGSLELPAFRTSALQVLGAAQAEDEVILRWWPTGPFAATAVLNGRRPETRASGDQPWPAGTVVNPGSVFVPTPRSGAPGALLTDASGGS